MILKRQIFSFKDKPLIEKLTVRGPFRYNTIFQNEGCFIYSSYSQPEFNSPNQKIRLKPKESVLLKCGSYYVDWFEDLQYPSCDIYAIHLYPQILNRIFSDKFPSFIKHDQKNLFIQKVNTENTITKFIESLDFYFNTPNLVNEDLLELKVKELILLLIQTKNAESIIGLISNLFTPKKVTIKDVINTHLFSNISLTKLAEFSNMSVSSFKREFKKSFNDTPINYINNKRLEYAKEKLLISNLTVSEIAYDLGFEDPAYFSRIFKKKFQVSPKNFRDAK